MGFSEHQVQEIIILGLVFFMSLVLCLVLTPLVDRLAQLNPASSRATTWHLTPVNWKKVYGAGRASLESRSGGLPQ